MGNKATVFYIYGRLKITDQWEAAPLHAIKEHAVGKFKHAIYSLGLKRRFHDYHKLFLYYFFLFVYYLVFLILFLIFLLHTNLYYIKVFLQKF